MKNEEYLREIEQFITQLKQYMEESKTLARSNYWKRHVIRKISKNF